MDEGMRVADPVSNRPTIHSSIVTTQAAGGATTDYTDNTDGQTSKTSVRSVKSVVSRVILSSYPFRLRAVPSRCSVSPASE